MSFDGNIDFDHTSVEEGGGGRNQEIDPLGKNLCVI